MIEELYLEDGTPNRLNLYRLRYCGATPTAEQARRIAEAEALVPPPPPRRWEWGVAMTSSPTRPEGGSTRGSQGLIGSPGAGAAVGAATARWASPAAVVCGRLC